MYYYEGILKEKITALSSDNVYMHRNKLLFTDDGVDADRC
jgi:hypothetical protein